MKKAIAFLIILVFTTALFSDLITPIMQPMKEKIKEFSSWIINWVYSNAAALFFLSVALTASVTIYKSEKRNKGQ